MRQPPFGNGIFEQNPDDADDDAILELGPVEDEISNCSDDTLVFGPEDEAMMTSKKEDPPPPEKPTSSGSRMIPSTPVSRKKTIRGITLTRRGLLIDLAQEELRREGKIP